METPASMQPQPNEPSTIAEPGLDPTRERTPRGRILVLLTTVWAVAFIVVGTWATYWAAQRNDQYQLINLGQCVYEGGRMYVDCWENKPPGIAWINALGIALSSGGQLGAWLLPGVTALLCLAGVGYAMARTISVTASCCSVALASVVYSLRLYDTPSINPDYYSSMFELAACSMWFLSLAAERRGPRFLWGLAAGLVWAAAASCKHTGIVGLLALSVVTIVVIACRRGNYRHWLVSCLWTWIGLALGLGAVAGVFAYRQTLGPAWEAIFGFNRDLLSWESMSGALRSWSRVWAGLGTIQLALWLGLLGAIVTLYTGRASHMARAIVSVMLLWWIAQVLGALTGPSQSMRYWQATFPPVLLMAGVGIYHLEDTFRQLDKVGRAALTVITVTVIPLLALPLAEHHRHGLATSYLTYTSDKTERNRLEVVGQQIQEAVPDAEPIYVWAYDAGTYLYANRRPASRFTYPRSPQQMHEILADLAAGKARAILVPEHRSHEFDLWCDEACHQRLSEVLARYEMKTTVGPYNVWARPAEDAPNGGDRP